MDRSLAEQLAGEKSVAADEYGPWRPIKCAHCSLRFPLGASYGRWVMPDGSDGGTCSKDCEDIYEAGRSSRLVRLPPEGVVLPFKKKAA